MKTSVKQPIYIYLNTHFLYVLLRLFSIFIVIHAIASETATLRHHERLDSFAYPFYDMHGDNSRHCSRGQYKIFSHGRRKVICVNLIYTPS